MKTILLILLVLVGAIVIVFFYGTSRWQARTEEMHALLRAEHLQTGIQAYDSSELEGLPGPVQRYFRAVLKDGQALVSAVTLAHTGTFNMGETAEQWKGFTSDQHVITRRPGFVWDARIRMAPGMTVFVHDAYVAGEGVLRAKVLGLLTVMELPRTPELAHGELMRFFAEAAWYPTALLPSQGVRWEAIDDTSARGSLTDGDTTVSLEFHFDGRGLIDTVNASGRYRVVDGKPVATPWQGRFWDYEPCDGMLVPREGEVAWLLPEGPNPYWRARIQRIGCEYAR